MRNMCINISDLKLSESESVDAYGEEFTGFVRYYDADGDGDNEWALTNSCS